MSFWKFVLFCVWAIALAEPGMGADEGARSALVAGLSDHGEAVQQGLIPPAYLGPTLAEQAPLFFCYGVYVALFLYNLFVWLVLRERATLIYLGVIASGGLLALIMSGHSLALFGFGYRDASLPIASAITMLLCDWFTIEYLALKKFSPLGIRAVLGHMLFVMVFLVTVPFMPLANLNALVDLLAATCVVAVILAGGQARLAGERSAKFFLLSVAALGGLLALYFGAVYQLLPYDSLTTYGFHYGLALQQLILAAGLADRAASLKQSLIEQITKDKSLLEQRVEQEAQAIRETQAQVIQKSRLASLGQMAGGIAHEISTPLSVISGSLFLMLELLENREFDGSKLVTCGRKALANCERIKSIISGLFKFAREGDQEPFRVTRVTEIVGDTLAVCRARFVNAGIDFHAEAIPERLTIECRPSQICQALLNLLNNAFDAVINEPGPWVRIEVEQQGGWVEIKVIDSGRGIPEELREKVFTPFFTTKEIGRGTGLGLSISHSLIDSNNGTLSLDVSSCNTSFVIDLPTEQGQRRDESNPTL